MKLIQRLGYYLGGFSIGLIILAFFFSGKRTSCAYFPEDRVLKNIGLKEHRYSDQAEQKRLSLALDTTAINLIISKGDVDFGASQTRKKPCGIYEVIAETDSGKPLYFSIENCEKIATILEIKSSN
ncbi:MAG: hypothetical protein ABNH00_00695 [Dokdonia sp.]|jgi:hypothetical protein|nr:hypothetical protein [Cytophagaceae bacterium]